MDNFFKNCPPKMNDSRHLTDYRTATRREEYIKYVNNVVRNDDHRLFLQQNADRFMNDEWNRDVPNGIIQMKAIACIDASGNPLYQDTWTAEKDKLMQSLKEFMKD